MLKSSLTAIVLMAVSNFAFAVDVVDSEPLNSQNASPRSSSPVRENRVIPAAGPDSYAQMQAMQEEIQELRGLVEQQTNELKRLKQQREDDYLDLDRRVSALSKGGASTSSKTEAALEPESVEKKTVKKEPITTRPQVVDTADAEPDDVNVNTSASDSVEAPTGDEYSIYSGALNLIVKTKDYDRGIAAMTKYLAQYPKGKYAPNAYFWVASAYQNQNKPEKSVETLEKMIKRYPREAKSDEARLKLARVYLQRGDKEEARLMLEEVIEAGGAQSGTAQDLLQKNF